MDGFRSRGVRALVALQFRELRALFEVWREARRRGVVLPPSEDPDYASLDHLVVHPVRSCGGYLAWLLETLGQPAPELPAPPSPETVAENGPACIDRLEREWCERLAFLTDEAAGSNETRLTRWGAPLTIEAMLEHAVVHPMRHRFQLEELLARG